MVIRNTGSGYLNIYEIKVYGRAVGEHISVTDRVPTIAEVIVSSVIVPSVIVPSVIVPSVIVPSVNIPFIGEILLMLIVAPALA